MQAFFKNLHKMNCRKLIAFHMPECQTALPYHIIKVKPENLEYGDKGEGLYYKGKESYVQ